MKSFLQLTFRNTQKHIKMIGFLYLINLSIALVFGILAFQKIKEATANSMAFEALIKTFDATVLFDFMRNGGEKLLGLVLISTLLSIVYLFLSVFFVGGILNQFQDKSSFKIDIFLHSSSQFFFRFLAIFFIEILFLVVLIIIGIILYFVFALFADGSTERGYFFWMLIPSTIIGLFITFILCSADISKNILFQNQHLSAWKAFIEAIKYLFKHPKLYKMYWLMILLSLVLYYAYTYISLLIPMSSGFTIVLTFILFQAYIFVKVFMKTWFLNNSYQFYSENPLSFEVPEEESPKLSE